MTVQYSLYLTLEKHSVKKKKEKKTVYLLLNQNTVIIDGVSSFFTCNGSLEVLFVTLQYIKTPFFLQYFVDPRPQKFLQLCFLL